MYFEFFLACDVVTALGADIKPVAKHAPPPVVADTTPDSSSELRHDQHRSVRASALQHAQAARSVRQNDRGQQLAVI